MASSDIDKLRNAVARRTNAIKDELDNIDSSDLTVMWRIIDIICDLQSDAMTLARDVMERKEEDFARDRDRYLDRRDDRNDGYDRGYGGRDSRSGRGGYSFRDSRGGRGR